MAKIGSCLKCIFIFFNFILGIVGGILLALAVLSQSFGGSEGEDKEEGHGLLVLYISGIVILVLAMVGAYGAFKENKVCLMVFKGFMIVGAILMIGAGFQLANARPQIGEMVEHQLRDLGRLDYTEKKMRQTLETIQTHMHCCGINSHQDWSDIPDSCDCIEGNECTQVSGSSYLSKERSIYSKPCGPIIKHYALLVLDVATWISYFLGIMAVLGVILSWIMVCQLRPPKNPSIPLTTKAVSTSEPPKYQELYRPGLY